MQRTLISLVGAGRFELPTPSPPDWCANQAALRSGPGAVVPRPLPAVNWRVCAGDLRKPGEQAFNLPLVRRKGPDPVRTDAAQSADGTQEGWRQLNVAYD